MKLISKIDMPLNKITKGKIYEGDLLPTITNPIDLKPLPPHYLIVCDDKSYGKFDATYFITIFEHRDKILNEILIK